MAFVSFAVPIGIAQIEADRYLVPLVPLAGVLAMTALFGWADRIPERFGRTARMAGALLVLLPIAWRGTGKATEPHATTQTLARRWCERSLAPDQLLVQEGYGASLPVRGKLIELESQPAFLHATRAGRERLRSVRAHRVASIPLQVAGACEVELERAPGTRVRLEVLSHNVDWNQVYYEPRLLRVADYVLTSSAVRHRFETDSVRYRRQAAFYRCRLRSGGALRAGSKAPRTRVAPLSGHRESSDVPVLRG
jgi:hypothetical protein